MADGSRHEGAETGSLLERLRGLAGPRRLLLVADSALVTGPNLAAADQAGIRFVSRLPRSFAYEDDALALDPSAWRPLRYGSERSARLPKARRPTWEGAEGTIDVVGPDRVARSFRVLHVRGSEEADAARSSRARLLARAEDSLARIERGLQARPCRDGEKVARRVAKAVASGRVGDWLRTEVVPRGDGALHLRWWRDEAALEQTGRRDGLYALVTNLRPRACCADRLLALYKDQALSERAHHFLKGPIAVRPVFLKSNRRAAALLQVCSIALLVYGLIESDVRAAIAPARTIPALLPEGRPARPTGANIFAAFTGLGYQRARTARGLECMPDPLSPAQISILDALGIPSILPPQADAPAKRCGIQV